MVLGLREGVTANVAVCKAFNRRSHRAWASIERTTLVRTSERTKVALAAARRRAA